jgi:hypothetical protein
MPRRLSALAGGHRCGHRFFLKICVRRVTSASGLIHVLAHQSGFRVQRGGVRRGDGEIFVSVDPATPARLRGGDAAAAESPGLRQQLSPGLLDLHAFDTELIPDVRRELHFFTRYHCFCF